MILQDEHRATPDSLSPKEEAAPLSPNAPDPSAELATAILTIETLKSKVLEVTSSRDSLLESLGSVQSTMASLQARVSDLEDENAELQSFKKGAEDKLSAADGHEATISNLRSSLEESRRVLMRLQNDKDVRTPSSNASNGMLAPSSTDATSKRDKRMSLGVGAPNRGERSHRRVSSISDSAPPMCDDASSLPAPPPPTVTKGGLRELRLSQAPPPPPSTASNSTGITSMFSSWGAGATTTTTTDAANRLSVAGTERSQVDLTEELEDDIPPEEARRQAMERLQGNKSPAPSTTTTTTTSNHAAAVVDPEEFAAVQLELQSVRSELKAAKLAREASEVACRALREFIAIPQAERERELEGMRLPPLPSDMADEDDQEAPQEPAGEKTTGLGSWFKRKASNPSPHGSMIPPSTLTAGPSASNVSNAGSTSTPLTTDDHPSTGSPAPAPPLVHSASFISSWTRGVSQSDTTTPSVAHPAPNTSTADSPPPVPPKSRFSFFTLKKGGGETGSMSEDVKSGPSTPAGTIAEEEPQDVGHGGEEADEVVLGESAAETVPKPVEETKEEKNGSEGETILEVSDSPVGLEVQEGEQTPRLV